MISDLFAFRFAITFVFSKVFAFSKKSKTGAGHFAVNSLCNHLYFLYETGAGLFETLFGWWEKAAVGGERR